MSKYKTTILSWDKFIKFNDTDNGGELIKFVREFMADEEAYDMSIRKDTMKLVLVRKK